MTKTIKLDQEVYQDLQGIRRKDETFSRAVSRLLRIYRYNERIFRALGPEETPKR